VELKPLLRRSGHPLFKRRPGYLVRGSQLRDSAGISPDFAREQHPGHPGTPAENSTPDCGPLCQTVATTLIILMDTQSSDYTKRLATRQSSGWKRVAPNPYRWWIRRLQLGTVLDVGCGIGRTLTYLDGNGVGVDHNETSIEFCRSIGLTAFTSDEFLKSKPYELGSFDSLISLHVLEHLQQGESDDLLQTYLPYVRPGGRVVLVTPQERGFASDSTHTHLVSGEDLIALCEQNGLIVDRWRSFPLPRWAGRLFIYNEFSVIAAVPETPSNDRPSPPNTSAQG
jgi:SAM-dependent methyltransferase